MHRVSTRITQYRPIVDRVFPNMPSHSRHSPGRSRVAKASLLYKMECASVHKRNAKRIALLFAKYFENNWLYFTHGAGFDRFIVNVSYFWFSCNGEV